MTEIPGLPHQGDMAIDCGAATLEANGVWITIRKGGKNTLICLELANAIQFAEKLRHAVDRAA